VKQAAPDLRVSPLDALDAAGGGESGGGSTSAGGSGLGAIFGGVQSGDDAAFSPDLSAQILRGYHPLTVRVKVTGSGEGTVWGTDVYTDDSPIDVAAVHAGFVTVGDSGEVLLTVEEGRESYASSERHGISSAPFHAFDGSYRLALDETVDAPYLASREALRGNEEAYLSLKMLAGQAPLRPGVSIIVPLRRGFLRRRIFAHRPAGKSDESQDARHRDSQGRQLAGNSIGNDHGDSPFQGERSAAADCQNEWRRSAFVARRKPQQRFGIRATFFGKGGDR
jgi:hypothetical protein